jgi:hypothetical protein
VQPDTNRVAAALDEAKQIADALHFACRLPDKKPDFTACGGPAAEAYWDYFTPARIHSFVDAVKAALELADDWAPEPGSMLAPTPREIAATALREAITAALTREGVPGGSV